MLTTAICDDDSYMLSTIKKGLIHYLKTHGIPAVISEFSSGEALLNDCHDFDIILLDMKLPGKNGIEVAKQLHNDNKNSQVIFITSYQEYAFDAFRVDAVHYLIKPVSDQDLFHALDKAIQWISQNDCKALTIFKGSSSQIIFIRDILYCESIDHKIFIHTTSGSYDFFGTLGALEKELDQRFFRCHKSYLINMNYVISKKHDTATVLGGGQVFVSRRKQQEFNKKLIQYFRRKVL